MNIKLLWVFLLPAFLLSCRQSPVGPVAGNGNVPLNFFIHQNYPNPFRDTTWIEYGVPSAGLNYTSFVSVLVFDKFHTPVRTLSYNHSHPAGTYTLIWDGRDDDYKKSPPGIYIIEMYGASPNTFISRIMAVRSK